MDLDLYLKNPTVGNELICNFLGLKFKKVKLPFGDQEAGKEIEVLETDEPFEFCNGYRLEHLKFHSSYDWIIPVWQYINGIDVKVEIDEMRITTKSSVIKAFPIPYLRGKSFISFYITTDFIPTVELVTVIWISVIEFIEWYKKQIES